MNLKLEAIIVPISDVDRAKPFYQETLGFRVDVDHRAAVYEKACARTPIPYATSMDLSPLGGRKNARRNQL